MKGIVLIVEDDLKNLKLLRDLLEVSGYSTLEAKDGRQGIEMAKAHKPALILMDIQMPIMDGLEATEILKADPETKDIPIIALTSHAMAGDEERIRKAGCDGYMSKPIDTRKFLKRLEQYFRDAPKGT